MTTLAPIPLSSDVLDQLRVHGFEVERGADESADSYLDRVDTALMSWFRDSGCREAFDALYRHSQVRVWSWLRWLVNEQRARLDPLELLQDTYVNVYRYAAGFRSDHAASFRVWVRTIAANVVRRAKTVAARLRYVSADETALAIPDGEHRSPVARVADGEESLRLRTAYVLLLQHYVAAFARLSPRDRRALELVEVHGRSYAETGRELGVGPSNMKMIMLRARRRLMNHMFESMGALTAAVAA